VIFTLTLYNNDTTPRHNRVESMCIQQWHNTKTQWSGVHVYTTMTQHQDTMEWSSCVGSTSLYLSVVSLLCSVNVLIISMWILWEANCQAVSCVFVQRHGGNKRRKKKKLGNLQRYVGWEKRWAWGLKYGEQQAVSEVKSWAVSIYFD